MGQTKNRSVLDSRQSLTIKKIWEKTRSKNEQMTMNEQGEKDRGG